MCIATALSKNLVLWTPVELFFRVDSHLLMLPSFCPPLIFLRGVHMLNYVRAAWCSSRLCYRYQISSKKEDRNARRSRFPKRAIIAGRSNWLMKLTWRTRTSSRFCACDTCMTATISQSWLPFFGFIHRITTSIANQLSKRFYSTYTKLFWMRGGCCTTCSYTTMQPLKTSTFKATQVRKRIARPAPRTAESLLAR